MRKTALGVSSFVLLVLFSTFLMTGFCFSTTPTHVDTSLDQGGYPLFTDMREIWVDHNTTYLRFKVNLGATWNQNGFGLYPYISINDSTGSDYAGMLNFSADYKISIWPDNEQMNFYDVENGSNDLPDINDYGLAYYIFSNNNATIEFGIRLQTYYNGVGYFNVSVGQTIKFQLQTSGDTDWAPNTEPLSFTLEAASGGGIPGFSWLLLNISLFLVIPLYLTRKRLTK
jgi:hypothetical protein